MLSDVQGRLNELAEKSPGITDPFESIYNIVYLLTMRAGGATEIATNRKLLDKTLSLYQTIESTATPYQIIFPWLPSPALFKRFFAGTRLYMLFQNLVNERKKTGKRYDDPLQYLIDQGDPMRNIIAVSN
jgi:sterol 14-demethylase